MVDKRLQREYPQQSCARRVCTRMYSKLPALPRTRAGESPRRCTRRRVEVGAIRGYGRYPEVLRKRGQSFEAEKCPFPQHWRADWGMTRLQATEIWRWGYARVFRRFAGLRLMKAGVLGDSLAYSGADVEATKPNASFECSKAFFFLRLTGLQRNEQGIKWERVKAETRIK